MSKPFDATMRNLIELEPAAWLRFLHIPVADPARVKVIDSNLSTFTAEADKVLWVGDPEPWIEHVELQAARNLDLPERVHWYSTIIRRGYKVPVHLNIILLRPAADGDELKGVFEQKDRRGDVYDWFRYNVVRVWERPVEEILAEGLPVLPLRRSRRSRWIRCPVCFWPSRVVSSVRPAWSRRQRCGKRPAS